MIVYKVPRDMRLVYSATLLFLACFFFPDFAVGQTTHKAMEAMQHSLLNGSFDNLPPFLSPEVGITMGGVTRMYDRNQAVYVLRQFTADHAANGFHIRSNGQTGNTIFGSGTYSSRSGSTFEVNIFVRLSGGTIDEIRIERS